MCFVRALSIYFNLFVTGLSVLMAYITYAVPLLSFSCFHTRDVTEAVCDSESSYVLLKGLH